MPLKGIKVLEFCGLAPAPFCGKILADFGASVTRIDRMIDNPVDCFKNGKKTLAINIKNPKSQNILRSLSKVYDVVLDPYRPGVLEKYNLGPKTLLAENPRLIFARLTGFGQTGPLSHRAGHDINYIALSGILSFLGRKSENPTPPINLLADFAGGGLLCAFGICLALLERHKSGKGQIIDSAMVEGCAYIGSWLMMSQNLPIWMGRRGENVLDTGAFYYDTYKTKDEKYMSVGAIETQFYDEFVKGLGLENLSQFVDNEVGRQSVSAAFLTKTQREWTEIFQKVDACVFPVLDWTEAKDFHHNKERDSFEDDNNESKIVIPKPAPKLSRTPGVINKTLTKFDPYKDAISILKDIGEHKNIGKLSEEGIILLGNKGKL